MTMCGAPVVFEISNLSLCCKTTPITSIKFECFSVACVCFICVLKKPLWSPEDWLSLIIMVLVTFEWQWWTQGRRESLAHCRNQQVVFLLVFFFFLSFEYGVFRFYHKTRHLEIFNEMFENLSNWGKWTYWDCAF